MAVFHSIEKKTPAWNYTIFSKNDGNIYIHLPCENLNKSTVIYPIYSNRECPKLLVRCIKKQCKKENNTSNAPFTSFKDRIGNYDEIKAKQESEQS